MTHHEFQETFGIRIYKEYFNFAAAHFLIFEDGTREELHGHNYQVQMALEGRLDGDRDVFIDFLDIKPIVKALCDSIDHRTLLPQFSQHLKIEDFDDRHLKAIYQASDIWVLPKRDVLVLPITNTSVERLAQYLCRQALSEIETRFPNLALRWVEFSVEESRGQASLFRLNAIETDDNSHARQSNATMSGVAPA